MAEPSPIIQTLITQIKASKIIMEATPEEIRRFGAKEGTLLQSMQTPSPMQAAPTSVSGMPILFNRHGTPIAYISGCDMGRRALDVTWSDPSPRYITGPQYINLHVEALPDAVTWLQSGAW
jgi:hypothetical protein